MGTFIKGTLVRNDDGATYDGEVYDRFLTLRAVDGRDLPIFDMGDPISTGLPTGRAGEMVLVAAVPGAVRLGTATSPTADAETWQGTVLDPRWRAQADDFSRARPELFEREWALVETPLGRLLMDPDEIGDAVEPGALLRWHGARLDLYAVV